METNVTAGLARGSNRMKTVLPKFTKKIGSKQTILYCQNKGCNKEFIGKKGVSKYCETCKNDVYRLKKLESNKKAYASLLKDEVNNWILTKVAYKNFRYSSIEKGSIVEKVCALEGCRSTFRVKIENGVYVYPNYCIPHRNQFKRELYLKNKAKECK